MANISTTVLNPAALTAFKSAMASTMAGVQASNIFIMNVITVTKSNLRFGVHDLNTRDRPPQDNNVRRNTILSSQLSTFRIFWNLTIALQSLEYSSASEAYASLTSQIKAATFSGSLAATLASLDKVYANVSVSHVFFAVLEPTMVPTPTPVATGGGSSSSDAPISGVIFISVGVGVGMVLCIGVAMCVWRTLFKKTKVLMNSHAEERQSLPLPAYYPKQTTVKYSDNPVRFQRQPRVLRNVQTSYL